MSVSVSLAGAVCQAVATAVDEDGAPRSAWPDRFPGGWATGTRIAELVGRSPAEIKHLLREAIDRGDVIAEHPWPAALRGYRPSPSWAASQHPTSLPLPMEDKRQWMLDALARWAALHDGLAPAHADWSAARDPDRRWPRADRVIELFGSRSQTTRPAEVRPRAMRELPLPIRTPLQQRPGQRVLRRLLRLSRRVPSRTKW